ncbi:MAG: tetratricopeptide repeat protein [Sedimentisphaerales bacterium]|nr:tetratricopeptide repeat protein [Sedimentisphaerales bacterium]
MNAKRYKILLQALLVSFMFQTSFAGSAQVSTSQGNRLYKQGKFDEAIKQYDQALIDTPEVLEPKFNKANSYYRLDDLDQSMNLYREVAAESKDMKLVTKAKYNLGNCSFQQGTKQRDSNLQKAIEDMETAIGYWRGVLDIEPEHQKAAKNIEVARLTIKDILDQLKNQQDPNQPQDPNQSQQQQQDQQQTQQQQGQDPNKPEDPNQQQDSKNDPNEPGRQQPQQQQQQAQEKDEEQKQKSDATAQEILDKEQRDKKQRQILQRARYKKVEKDW